VHLRLVWIWFCISIDESMEPTAQTTESKNKQVHQISQQTKLSTVRKGMLGTKKKRLPFHSVSLVEKWRFYRRDSWVRVNARDSAPHSSRRRFRLSTLDTRVQQICRAPQKSSKTFPANWEHSTTQRKATPERNDWFFTYLPTN